MKRPPALYRQTTEWTCGPSCVFMLRSIFEKNLSFTRSDELELWRKTITEPQRWPYTTHPRLAIELMDAGYCTELWHLTQQCFEFRPGGVTRAEFDERMTFYRRFRDEAVRRGAVARYWQYSAVDIRTAVAHDDTVAIVFSRAGNTSRFFHHRLVYDRAGEGVLVACPVTGLTVLSTEELDSITETHFGRGALIIHRPDVRDD